MFKNTIDNKRYYTLNCFYKNKFNSKVCKISLNANFSCPNKDGTVGYGGCVFCSKLRGGWNEGRGRRRRERGWRVDGEDERVCGPLSYFN